MDQGQSSVPCVLGINTVAGQGHEEARVTRPDGNYTLHRCLQVCGELLPEALSGRPRPWGVVMAAPHSLLSFGPTPEKLELIRALRLEGWSYLAISCRVEISRERVSSICKLMGWS